MSFARKVWHLIVAVKDGLSLLFLLLFFFALYAVLTARPSAGQVRDGALLLKLDGSIVEEKAAIDPLTMILSQKAPVGEYQARDLVRAIEAAAGDDRVKAVVLDLSRFTGGGLVNLTRVGAALDKVRAAKKPVLAWSVAYTDGSLLLASHASEVWVDPMGGAAVRGPGGNYLFYGSLLKRLKVDAHVFKVGTYKSAVEPYILDQMSDPARENTRQVIDALWAEWQADVAKARPQAKIAAVAQDPVGVLAAANNDLATAARNSGLVDRIGDRVAFGKRVAEIAGEDPWDKLPGTFAHTELDPWLADNPAADAGKPIGVITIANEIVDGEAGPGSAGGDRIAKLLDDALDDNLAGLVVRVDSPGGSVMASEEIRRAIMRHKAAGIPIAVSMGNLAASGGYWVSTPAQRIFAEPETITGSIGVFMVVPTFEQTLAEWGVHSDGVKTTALSGQPDLFGGLSPVSSALLQAGVDNTYRQFLAHVSAARKITPARADELGQGRIWDGGTARQLGLVDQYGGIEDALAWVAAQAKLKDGDWHAQYLGEDTGFSGTLLRRLVFGDESREAAALDLPAALTGDQGAVIGRMSRDLSRLLTVRGAQAMCLACGAAVPAPATPRGETEARGWLMQLLSAFGKNPAP